MDVLTLLPTNAIAASVLAIVVAIACALIRRPAFTSRAWLLVLVKLLVPPVVGVPVFLLAAEKATEFQTKPIDAENPVYVSRSSEITSDLELLEEFLAFELTNPADQPLPTVASELNSIPAAPPVPPQAAPPRWQFDAPTIHASTISLWLLGTAIYWSWALVGILRFRRMLMNATAAPPEITAIADDLARRMGLRHAPAITVVAADISPMVWTTLRGPRVLLPRALWERLSDSQRRAVLAHELAHICRGDVWVRWLELVVLGIYWWSPVAWLARRQLRSSEEACCDAWVIWALPDQAPAYAEALVETAAFVSSPRFVPLASGGAARLSSLKRRISMILQQKPAHRLRWPLALALAALALALLPWRPMFVEAQQPPATSSGKTDPAAKASNPASTTPAPKTSRTSDPTTTGSGSVPRTGTPTSGNWPSNPIPRATLEAIEEEFALLEAQLATRRAIYRGAEVELKAQTVHLDEVKRGVAANWCRPKLQWRKRAPTSMSKRQN